MAVKQLSEDLYVLPGLVNVYMLRSGDGLVVIDTGFPGSAKKILDGVRALGQEPSDVRHILLTHAHPDHIGSAAALRRETGATVWAHPLDAPIIEAGSGFRPVKASPGLLNALVTRFLLGRIKAVEPTRVDRFLEEGDRPPFLPDLTVTHVPGHCAGQVAFVWSRHGGVLFPADTCVNLRGPKLPPAVENLDVARASLTRLAALDVEAVCYMHGRPVMRGGGKLLRRASLAGW